MASYIPRSGIFHDPGQLKRNLYALNEQRNLSQFCDVVLRVCGTQIYAHSNILAAASPYFGSFLGVGNDCPRMFSQKHPQIIEIHIDTKDGDGGYGEAVSKVVEYMYTSQITLTTTLVCQIIEIGKIMQMDRLLEFCENFQNGEDGNEPRHIATCTSGLQEIASLLGKRSRILKRADASTETEETMFKKVEVTPEVTHRRVTIHVTPENNFGSDPPETTQEKEEVVCKEEIVCNDPQQGEPDQSTEEDHEPCSPVADSGSIGFDTGDVDQNDASLLLAISNVRPPVQAGDAHNATASEKPVSPGRETDQPAPFRSNSQYSSDDCLSNVRTLADMMNIAVEKSGEEVENAAMTQEPGVEAKGADSENVAEEPMQQDTQQKDKDLNLDEISDLVRFDPVTTALLQAPLRGQGRGRPRGRSRGRGRGRGRGRRPGRPRKAREEEESDPEFEELMVRVENGDNIVSPEPAIENENERMDVDESSALEEDDTNLSKEKTSDEKGAEHGKWTSKGLSRRRRSKPSQLRKDYIMHSLTKKSRKDQSKTETDLDDFNSQTVGNKSQGSRSVSSSLKFVCQKCDFTTSHFKEYRQHMKTHPETDPRHFVCEKCNYKTTKSREFTAHKHKHMIEELICSFCEHQSGTQAEFAEHAAKHEGDYPYFCTECDSRFKTKNQLMAHKPKHQLEKPFVCAICNAGFKWKHALKNHMITHSATKDHLCDVCGYATAHKSQLKAHKLIHTGLMFKCPVQGCQFEATKRQNLKYHMVTHTHEKPHQCDICGQSFSLIKNMRRHMLLHTDSRPFSCKICSFSTTRYDKLKEHNHKLHNIGEAPVPKKDMVDQTVSSLLKSSITYHKAITINTEGGISEETLQTIAQLASAQNAGGPDLQATTINIEQTGEDGTVYPIIATVKSYTDSNGEVQYIAEVPQ